MCETFQLPIAVHSSGELGIQLATMLHLGAVLPNLTYSADAHYHHLRDDVIVGGKMPYPTGRSPCRPARAWVSISTATRSPKFAEEFRRLGNYNYDRDPGRPGVVPARPEHPLGRPERRPRPRSTDEGAGHDRGDAVLTCSSAQPPGSARDRCGTPAARPALGRHPGRPDAHDRPGTAATTDTVALPTLVGCGGTAARGGFVVATRRRVRRVSATATTSRGGRSCPTASA